VQLPVHIISCSQDFRHLKPGGYIEHVEIDFEPRCDDGSLPTDPLCTWYDYLKAATKRMHRPIEYNPHTGTILRTAGFVDIVEHKVIKLPMNSWPTEDEKEREIGRWNVLGLVDSIEAWSLKPLIEVNGWDEKTVKSMVEDVRKAVKSRKVRAYNLM